MSARFSLTDTSTWVTILTVVAAALADVFHRSFAPYVPAAATIAAGLVVAFVALAKHHFAAALAEARATVKAAESQLPASSSVASASTAAAAAPPAAAPTATPAA